MRPSLQSPPKYPYASRFVRGRGFLALASFFTVLAAPHLARAANLRVFPGKYHEIHSDLDDETVRDVALRMTKMAEEYHARTKDFAGQITRRLPFYLFREEKDYIAAGAPPGTAGVFMLDKLMAVTGAQVSDWTWHVIQHEGFHQFVHAVIGGDIPTWVNEGMAEYFGEAVFTGEGFVTGLIPRDRLARVKQQIRTGRGLTIEEMMQLSLAQWNAMLSGVNYDQAWSMVYFLAHGENGKYRPYFDGFLRDVGAKRGSWEQAWLRNFGPGVADFERKWRDYWLSQPENPSELGYANATVLTLTAVLARAVSQDQEFDDVDSFFAAARAATLKSHPDDWLPPSLIRAALRQSEGLGEWKLENNPRTPPRLSCVVAGRKLIGKFTVGNGRVRTVTVEAR